MATLRDWHAATAALEAQAFDQRLALSLDELERSKNSDPKAQMRRAHASSLQLDCLRRQDEVLGFHRRQQEREFKAARAVAPLVESMRGWSGNQEDDGRRAQLRASTSTSRFSVVVASSRLGGGGVGRRFNKNPPNNNNSNDNNNPLLASPLRQLLGGLELASGSEPWRCADVDAAMQEAFLALKQPPPAPPPPTSATEDGIVGADIAAAAAARRRLRVERLEFLSAYLQVVVVFCSSELVGESNQFFQSRQIPNLLCGCCTPLLLFPNLANKLVDLL
jgi:hypothetical protein